MQALFSLMALDRKYPFILVSVSTTTIRENLPYKLAEMLYHYIYFIFFSKRHKDTI